MSREELKRLSTFAKRPVLSSGIRNFASKAAAAFFERSEDCCDDEVVCSFCGVSYKNWTKESPAAVHRTISRKCPALNPSSDDVREAGVCGYVSDSLKQNPFNKHLPDHILREVLQAELPFTQEDSSDADSDTGTVFESATPEAKPHYLSGRDAAVARHVRRQLFADHDSTQPSSSSSSNASDSDSETASVSDTSDSVHGCTNIATGNSNPPSVLSQPAITHPVRPKCGGYDNLFASVRVKTFPGSPTAAKNQAWAEEGFVFREIEGDVMCVYCGTCIVLNGHQPKVAHQNTSPSCPFVMGFDVGNISQQDEKDILCKYFEQKAAEEKTIDLITIQHPKFAEEDSRLGSFETWPKMYKKVFPADLMASAGFFFTGKLSTFLFVNFKETLLALGRDLFTFSSKVIKRLIIL
jgi:hypothetical protein